MPTSPQDPTSTPHPTDVHVGRQLRARRVRVGMSQEKLAAAVGLTFQQVQKYERGVNRISASRLYDFSKVLDVPISYFFEDLDTMTPAEGLAEESAPFVMPPVDTRGVAELVRLFNALPSTAMRRQVLSLVRSVAASVTTSTEGTPPSGATTG